MAERDDTRTGGDTLLCGRNLLYGHKHSRLRATWRVLAPLVVATVSYVIGQLLVELLATSILGSGPGGVSAGVGAAASLVGLSAVIGLSSVGGLVVASRLDRRPMRRYVTDGSGRWPREFAAGVVIGVGAAAGSTGYLLVRGHATLSPEVSGVGVESVLLGIVLFQLVLVYVLVNAAFEEVVFRSILVTNAAEGLRSRGFGATAAVVAGVAVSLPLFGALHLLGGGVPAVLTGAIGGILFAAAYVLSGQLALPIGVHVGGVAIVSLFQQSVSAEPELTLPSVVVADWTVEPSLAVSIELWVVRAALGIALVCLWVYSNHGTLSIHDRIAGDPGVDSRR